MRLEPFRRGQHPSVAGIKQSENLLVCLSTQMVLKYSYLETCRVMLPQTRGQLDFLMAGIIVPDESTDESDHDQQRRRLFSGRASRRVRRYRHGQERTCHTTIQPKHRKKESPVGKPAQRTRAVQEKHLQQTT
jgi:hypothetical protein